MHIDYTQDMHSDKLITRFAPTPSGYIHQGNAYNFLLTWLVARKLGGKIALRIDDIDSERTEDKYIQDIFDSLNWLGLSYDLGPKNIKDFKTLFSQQKKIKTYKKELLKISPKFVCSCTRKEIKKVSSTGIYPGTCRKKETPFFIGKTSIRLNTENNFQGTTLRDFILWNKNDKPSYQLVSVIEDQQLGVNLIVRGEDLSESTKAQIYLAKALKIKKFRRVKFIHHSLVLNGKEKLSKSSGSSSLETHIEKGLSAFYSNFSKFMEYSVPSNSLSGLLENLPSKFLF